MLLPRLNDVKGDDGLPVAPYAEDTEGGGKFVNRADCFLTIHRKVQHPDFAQRKITEFHVRKVRDVETGGEPTSLDEPIRFEMNTSRTAFRVWKTQELSINLLIYRAVNRITSHFQLTLRF
jgi:hypothetical protein